MGDDRFLGHPEVKPKLVCLYIWVSDLYPTLKKKSPNFELEFTDDLCEKRFTDDKNEDCIPMAIKHRSQRKNSEICWRKKAIRCLLEASSNLIYLYCFVEGGELSLFETKCNLLVEPYRAKTIGGVVVESEKGKKEYEVR